VADAILIAEPDREIATGLELDLAVEGWDVHVVHDGLDALDQARKLQPALVVVDESLPGLDGVELCASLRRDVRTVNSAVILLGEDAGPAEKLRGFAAGADDYVVKPFDPAELVARVRSVLRRANQMRDLSPLTHLPGNFRIASELERLVTRPEAEFAVLYADLNEFKAFNDYYGFLRGDEVIKFTARILLEALSTHPGEPSFAGHVGGDDFVLLCEPELAEPLCADIVIRFDRGVRELYDPDDAAAGHIEVADRRGNLHRFGLTSVAIGVATTTQRPIRTQWEASVIATEMKAHAKRHGRSAYEVDRRER
jgi:diguanylate cyclase (GGDEF)-like protein